MEDSTEKWSSARREAAYITLPTPQGIFSIALMEPIHITHQALDVSLMSKDDGG